MRTKPAKKWDSNSQHNQFGVYNWFRNHKGITNQEVMKEIVAAFCLANGMEVTSKTQESAMLNFAGNRFQKFATFAGNYIKENNYA